VHQRKPETIIQIDCERIRIVRLESRLSNCLY